MARGIEADRRVRMDVWRSVGSIGRFYMD